MRWQDILHGKAKPAEMPIQTQKDFKTTINMKTAARIGLSVPEELLKRCRNNKIIKKGCQMIWAAFFFKE